jgi:hypothetical protein
MRTLVLWMGSVESLACVTRRVSKVQPVVETFGQPAADAAMSRKSGDPAGHLPAGRMSSDRAGRPTGPMHSNMGRSADWASA